MRDLEIKCGISFLVLSFYIVACFYSVYFVDISSDTLHYLNNYNNIAQNPYPFGYELGLSILMWLCSFVGMSFDWFLITTLMLWVPFIYVFTNRYVDNVVMLLSSLFFITPFFIENALFLIRNYVALSLFISAMVVCGNLKRYTLLAMSVITHFSIIILVILLSKHVYNLILRNRTISWCLLSIAVLCMIFVTSSEIISIINLEVLKGVLPQDIYRKVSFYNSANEYGAANNMIILISIFASVLVILNKSETEYDMRFSTLVFAQCLICIALSNVGILSNRLGIIGFLFSIPISCFYLSKLMKSKNEN